NLPDPPDGEWHIAAIGGSTTAGSPYHPRFGIPPVVRWRLERAWSSSESAGGGASAERPRTIVVHNLAQMGHNLRLAARQLRELRYRPHVLLVYAGHNEFYHDLEELHPMRESPFSGLDRWLRRSPLFRVAQGVFAGQFMQQRLKHGASRRLIDAPMATAELARRRLARFRRQLEELAGFCERAGIATLWFVPAGSESGFDPNRSFVNENATADAQADVERLYSEARAHENAGRWSAAATVYRRGLERQPKFAEFHFRLGECLAAEGRLAEAGPHFALALEHDGHPIRATREYRRAIAEVAARRGIPCIDAAGVLRPHAAEGILDRTLFNDNVHPTLRGYFLLGIAAADRIASDRPDLFRPPSELPAPDFGAAVAELGVGVEELAAACEVTATGLEWLAGLRFDGSARLRVARQFSEWARRLRAGEIQPGEDGSESAGRPRIRPGAQ
ncbi:MAG TPA: tetratricopeptide repeat protein, partial [Planctomycetaceae bacterium]|nr:tetratricopeptide repeat protein [Planctomycetaceae bacterium]